MTSAAAETASTRKITADTAQFHERRLREVIPHLPPGCRYLIVSSIRWEMTGGSPRPQTHLEPELNVRDHQGRWRTTILVSGDEFAVRLPGSTVYVQRVEQAALLAGRS
ncbi:hypothetical protein AB0M95_19400 [Sphaerisporangium sp. NPDC051017]|uniref:hypothetical protein n=1 Tax=Sphaerisporangium sp. NPDC051017 TaxID=3154636 RepID=UPI003411F990